MEVPSANDVIGEPMNSYNCMDYLLHAEKDDFKEQKRKLASLKENFNRLCSGRSFLLLTEQQLYKFLTLADLRTITDLRLFHYLTEWYRYDPIDRGYLMSELMSKFIRIELLEGKPVACEWNMSHRPQIKLGKTVLASLDPNSKTGCFKSYNPERMEWLIESWPQRAMESSYSSMLYYNNKFILSGGLHGSNVVEYLNLESLEWYELPPMREGRYFHVTTAVDGYLYMISGLDKNAAVIVSVEKYDFRTREWQDVAPLPAKFIPESATSMNGLIYVASKPNAMLYCYDPHTNGWTQTPRRELGSALHHLVALNGYIYALDKVNKSTGIKSTIQRYDVAQDIWSDVSPLEKSSLIHTATATLKGRLLVLVQKGEKSKLKRYSPRTDTWTTLYSHNRNPGFGTYLFQTS